MWTWIWTEVCSRIQEKKLSKVIRDIPSSRMGSMGAFKNRLVPGRLKSRVEQNIMEDRQQLCSVLSELPKGFHAETPDNLHVSKMPLIR